MFLVRSMSS